MKPRILKWLRYLLATVTLPSVLANGATLRVGNGDEPQALDPHLVTGMPASRILHALFEGLVRLDPATLAVVPAAAASWEVSADGLVWTFRMDPESRWSDGQPVTAEDFRFAFQRILTPTIPAYYASNLFVLRGARAFNEGSTRDFSTVGVRCPAPDVLELTLENPVPYFLGLIQHTAWYPVPRHVIEQWGATDTPNQEWTRPGRLVGNGPFRLAEWRTNHFIRVEARTDIPEAARPGVDAIEFYPIPNYYTEARAFADRLIHKTENLPGERIEPLLRQRSPALRIEPDFATYYLTLNCKEPPLDQPLVRKALALAIDRSAIVRDIRQRGERIAAHLCPPVFPDYTSPPLQEFNPEAARAALAAAGYPGGKGFPRISYLFNTSETHRPIAEAIQAMWKEVLGIEIELANKDWKSVLEARRRSDFQILRSGWIGDYFDPMTFLDLFESGSSQNFGGWSDPRFDAHLEEARRSRTPAERLRAYTAAETVLLESAPLIPLFFYNRAYLLDPQIEGWHPNVMNIPSWRTVHFAPN